MTNMQIMVEQYGGPEVLKAVTNPLRPPHPDEVRIRVESAGVALADVMRREGVYPASPTPPFTPGYDAVGIVDAIGSHADGFRPGDRAAVLFAGTGGYASYVYVQAKDAIPVPAAVDAAKAAAVLLNYVTAYQMLYRLADVREGETVLIHGAAGGVGTALLELGRLAGLRMYGTASAAKHPVVRSFGAVPIDYRNEDFAGRIHSLSPAGVDAVFDPVGGDNWERSLRTLAPGGRFVGYGYTDSLSQGNARSWIDDWSRLAAGGPVQNGRAVHLYSITTLARERPEWYRADAARLLRDLERGDIDPLIAARVPLKEASEAHRLLESGASAGKIVLVTQ